MRCSSVWFKSVASFALLFAVGSVIAQAEDGSAAWLRYAPITNPALYKDVPGAIVSDDPSSTGKTAAKELQRALSSMLRRPFTIQSRKTHSYDYPHGAIRSEERRVGKECA